MRRFSWIRRQPPAYDAAELIWPSSGGVLMPSPITFRRREDFRRLLAMSSLILFTFVFANVSAQQCERAPVEDRPRIGLALGGGGARGGAHIGVLKVLEELRIPVDYVAGTSMGSIVGALYSSGMGVEELETAILEADWDDLFADSTEREDRPLRRKSDDDLGLYNPAIGVGKDNELLPGGAVAGQKIIFLFESLTSRQVQIHDFDQLPIPYRAVAADIVSGEMVVMDHGDLSVAMRSSMSVPGAFDPMQWEGHMLVDGGIVRNLPIDVVRNMGADVVIAVNVGTLPKTADELGTLLAIVGQMSSLMINHNTSVQIEEMHPGDILLTPELGHQISAADFAHVDDTIPIGYAAADAARADLRRLSVSEAEYRSWRQGVNSCVTGPPTIQFVKLENSSRFSDEVLLEKIEIEPGVPLDYEVLDANMRQIYALGFIRLASYRIEKEDGQKGVVIKVDADPRGSDFIQSGIEIFGDERDSGFNIKLAYLKTDLSDRGAEVRTAFQVGEDFGALGELYYPIDNQLRWIFRPEVRYSRREIDVFDPNGGATSEWNIDEYGGRVGFGREFGRHVGLFGGVRSYIGQAKVGIGTPGLSDFRYKGGEWFFNARYDRLDDRYLPSRGSFANLTYLESEEGLGADAEFEQVLFSWFMAHTWDRHTLQLATRYNTTLDDNAPVYALFSGGGFVNMSGFKPNELVGQHFAGSLIGYRYEVGRTGFLPAYVGTTVEYGNTAFDRDDLYDEGIWNGSFYFAYKSPIGPLYLGLGWSEDHSGLLFLRVGSLLNSANVGSR